MDILRTTMYQARQNEGLERPNVSSVSTAGASVVLILQPSEVTISFGQNVQDGAEIDSIGMASMLRIVLVVVQLEHGGR